MPSVRIEDDAFGDLRYDRLAVECGLADADHARGKMARLWRQCTAEKRYVLPESDVVSVLGPNAIAALEFARLGDRVAGGIRIRGTRGRIEWLENLRKNGRKGGRPAKTKREPSGFRDLNPPALVPALVPSPAPVRSEPEPPKPPKGGMTGRSRSAKSDSLTEVERAIALRVLSKITERTGVKYGRNVTHLQLVAARLREGCTERELRAVIAYCWDGDGLNWREKTIGEDGEAMSQYLRPETLFGPRKIGQYMPPALAWLEKHFPNLQPESREAAPSPVPMVDLFGRHERGES